MKDFELKALDRIFRARYNDERGVARVGEQGARIYSATNTKIFSHTDANRFMAYLWAETKNRIILKESGRWCIKLVPTAVRPYKSFTLILCRRLKGNTCAYEEIYNITGGYWYIHAELPDVARLWLVTNWCKDVKRVISNFNEAKFLGA